MAAVKCIAPCLWFDSEAEEAAKFYVSIFEDAKIETISHYGKEGFEKHGRPAGSVMTVSFRLMGQPFTALNGGPLFKFNEAISLQIHCETQKEIDHYWSKLTAEGGSEGPCGWLKDKYGLSWQLGSTDIDALMSDRDPAAKERVIHEVMRSTKPDLERFRRAHAGKL